MNDRVEVLITGVWLAAVMALTAASCSSGDNGSDASAATTSTVTDDDDGNASDEFASDDELLDYIQEAHIDYMWNGAESTSGLAPERIHLDGVYPNDDAGVVTTGGSGFGIAGLLVAIERGFIGRDEGVTRLTKIVDYLSEADRFHGVWPHWLDGPTGTVVPFSTMDDGGDIVESSFLMQSLLCARQYFKDGSDTEQELAAKIDTLWQEMEFDWYTCDGQDVIYWHWSPNYAWAMNFPIEGYNECLIVYILAASSPTHPVPSSCYHNGWARGGDIVTSAKCYGYALGLKHNDAEYTGGPLFWAHYSYLCLDPRNLSDQYANYWSVVQNHALSNYQYCVTNPKNYTGYGSDCWGLTASYSPDGYSAHAPGNDLGVIAPTAALSSFPYTPEQSMAALKHFYDMKSWIWGEYGFYDAFSETENWTLPRYLAIDQCIIAPMIENYRTGLLWDLFMSCEEVQTGLANLGFTVGTTE